MQIGVKLELLSCGEENVRDLGVMNPIDARALLNLIVDGRYSDETGDYTYADHRLYGEDAGHILQIKLNNCLEGRGVMQGSGAVGIYE